MFPCIPFNGEVYDRSFLTSHLIDSICLCVMLRQTRSTQPNRVVRNGRHVIYILYDKCVKVIKSQTLCRTSHRTAYPVNIHKQYFYAWRYSTMLSSILYELLYYYIIYGCIDSKMMLIHENTCHNLASYSHSHRVGYITNFSQH